MQYCDRMGVICNSSIEGKRYGTEEKYRIWKDVVTKTNEDFEGGMKEMWAGIKGVLGKQAGEGRHGNSYVKSTER